MGLFDKLFEHVADENETDVDFGGVFSEPDISVPEVELETVNRDTLISDIYNSNGLSDMANSIFKVEELIDSLPKEMPTITKQSSALKILSSFGLTAEGVSSDGEGRIQILTAAREKINRDGENLISDRETAIEEHKRIIAQLEKEIADEKDVMEHSNSLIAGEVDRVAKLVKFINPGGAA